MWACGRAAVDVRRPATARHASLTHTVPRGPPAAPSSGQRHTQCVNARPFPHAPGYSTAPPGGQGGRSPRPGRQAHPAPTSARRGGCSPAESPRHHVGRRGRKLCPARLELSTQQLEQGSRCRLHRLGDRRGDRRRLVGQHPLEAAGRLEQVARRCRPASLADPMSARPTRSARSRTFRANSSDRSSKRWASPMAHLLREARRAPRTVRAATGRRVEE